MSENTVLVTGAARGLGLEFCRQLAARGERVIACPRKEGERDLTALAGAHPDRIRVVPLDVVDRDAVRAVADALSDTAIDVLIANAGVYPDGGSAANGFDRDAIETALRVNAIAPLELASALLPSLRRGKRRTIAHVTSLMGSIADNTSGGSYAYRISKTALNMATRNLAHELATDGFTVLALHPGWVRTRMGGSAAPLAAEPSVAGMLRVIDDARPERSGSFLAHDGTELPW